MRGNEGRKEGDESKGKVVVIHKQRIQAQGAKQGRPTAKETHLRKSCLRLSGRFDLPAYPGFMVTKMAMSGFTFTVFPTSSTVIGFAPGVSGEGGRRKKKGRGQGMIEGGEQCRGGYKDVGKKR